MGVGGSQPSSSAARPNLGSPPESASQSVSPSSLEHKDTERQRAWEREQRGMAEEQLRLAEEQNAMMAEQAEEQTRLQRQAAERQAILQRQAAQAHEEAKMEAARQTSILKEGIEDERKERQKQRDTLDALFELSQRENRIFELITKYTDWDDNTRVGDDFSEIPLFRDHLRAVDRKFLVDVQHKQMLQALLGRWSKAYTPKISLLEKRRDEFVRADELADEKARRIKKMADKKAALKSQLLKLRDEEEEIIVILKRLNDAEH